MQITRGEVKRLRGFANRTRRFHKKLFAALGCTSGRRALEEIRRLQAENRRLRREQVDARES